MAFGNVKNIFPAISWSWKVDSPCAVTFRSSSPSTPGAQPPTNITNRSFFGSNVSLPDILRTHECDSVRVRTVGVALCNADYFCVMEACCGVVQHRSFFHAKKCDLGIVCSISHASWLEPRRIARGEESGR